MVAAKIAGIKTVPKMCSLEDKLLCACEDSYLPEKYIEQTKQLITTRIAVLKEGWNTPTYKMEDSPNFVCKGVLTERTTAIKPSSYFVKHEW